MTGVSVKKREGEPSNSLIYRFTKKVQQSGVLREARKRRFSGRFANKSKRHRSALYKAEETKRILKEKKLGIL